FVGNNLALDFLNTRPVQNGEATELLEDFESLLRWFQAAELMTANDVARIQRRWSGSQRTRGALRTAIDLREKLRKEVIAWEAGANLHRSTIDELNRIMAEHPMRTKVKAGQNGPEKELWFGTETLEDLLAPVAHSAATLFTNLTRDRVRKCGECVLHFYD